MADYQAIEDAITKACELPRRPIAIAFKDAPPPGITKFDGTVPSGCSFWRIAAEGGTFYTVPSDHYNCAVGSYTHNIELPKERAAELEQTLSFMTQVRYIRMEEIPGFARLPRSPGVIVYAPLGDTPVDPDVVLFVGRPGRISLLMEAATRAGIAAKAPFLGRPSCSALAATLAEGAAVSTACIGNRVYTDLGEDELYAAIRGSDVKRLATEAQTIAAANLKLADYHRARRKELATQ